MLGCGYAAPTLLPVTWFVGSDRFVDARSTIDHPDAMTSEMVLRTDLDRYQNRGLTFAHQRSTWYEFGMGVPNYAESDPLTPPVNSAAEHT